VSTSDRDQIQKWPSTTSSDHAIQFYRLSARSSQMSWVINRSGACHRPSSFLGHRPRCPAPGLYLVPLRSPVAVHPSQQPAISSFLWRPQSADARVVVPRAPHLQKKSSGPVSPPPLPCGWKVPAVIFSVAIPGAALPSRPPSPFPPHPARHCHLPLPSRPPLPAPISYVPCFVPSYRCSCFLVFPHLGISSSRLRALLTMRCYRHIQATLHNVSH